MNDRQMECMGDDHPAVRQAKAHGELWEAEFALRELVKEHEFFQGKRVRFRVSRRKATAAIHIIYYARSDWHDAGRNMESVAMAAASAHYVAIDELKSDRTLIRALIRLAKAAGDAGEAEAFKALYDLARRQRQQAELWLSRTWRYRQDDDRYDGMLVGEEEWPEIIAFKDGGDHD